FLSQSQLSRRHFLICSLTPVELRLAGVGLLNPCACFSLLLPLFHSSSLLSSSVPVVLSKSETTVLVMFTRGFPVCALVCFNCSLLLPYRSVSVKAQICENKLPSRHFDVSLARKLSPPPLFHPTASSTPIDNLRRPEHRFS
ncbi:unnamed protein product, partial [Brassica napus]